MEPEIKRINFFDGLFLRQEEFLAEQLYHLHMRRRINFMLFESSGVVPLETGDLDITPTGGKAFHVTPGMAVSYRGDLKEGREVILTENSPEVDLAPLFSAGDTVVVALHYEEGLAEPQTGVSPSTETRINEQAVLTVHELGAFAAAPPPPDGESYIPIGRVDFDSMVPTQTAPARQFASVRSALFGGGISPAAPSIASMTPNSGAAPSAVAVQITGTNLSGASVTSSDAAAVVSGVVATATTVDFNLTIGAAASSFTITVDTGVAPPDTRNFTIGGGATPAIAFLSPPSQATGSTVQIRGTSIHNAALAVGTSPVAGTTVVLTDGTNVVPVPDTEVRPVVSGNQSIRFTVPPGHGSWSGTETVTLELTFDGGVATAPFSYDD